MRCLLLWRRCGQRGLVTYLRPVLFTAPSSSSSSKSSSLGSPGNGECPRGSRQLCPGSRSTWGLARVSSPTSGGGGQQGDSQSSGGILLRD